MKKAMYSVLILISLMTGISSCEKNKTTDNCTPCNKPTFTIDKKTTTAPLHVVLTNTTSESIVVQWNFGNGKTSTAATGETVYNRPGTYTITLKVTKDGQEQTGSQQIVVTEDPDLIAYYAFNGTTKDTSGRSFDAVLVNGASYATGKNAGEKALYLGTTTGYARFPQGLISNANTNLPRSFSLWFRPDIGVGGLFGFHDNHGTAGAGNTPVSVVSVHTTSGGAGPGRAMLRATAANSQTAFTEINLNEWHHLIWINNGVSSALYIDGTLYTNMPGSSHIPNLHYGHVGYAYSAGGDFYFMGLIDDVRLYKKALTPADIIALTMAY